MSHHPAGLSKSRRFGIVSVLTAILCTLFFFQNCASDIPQEYLELASYEDADGDGSPDIPPGPLSCKSNQLLYQGNCYDRYRACTLPNGIGREEFTTTAGGYGICTLQTCNANYHNENGVCTPNVRACTIAGGSGQQAWNGTTYGACVATGCQALYHLEGTQCMPDTRNCSIANGTGTQTWNGASYGACNLMTCNTGFIMLNNQCLGPVSFIYRYSHPTAGSWLSTQPNDTGAQSAGFTYQADIFKTYQAANGVQTIPLYRCAVTQNISGTDYVQYYFAHTTCINARQLTTIGHLSRQAGLNSANRAIYYCIPPTPAGAASPSRPITTDVLSECQGAPNTILGYGFD